jgi:hypothetical protein
MIDAQIPQALAISNTTLHLATADRLHLIVNRSCAWPDERDDISLALQVLSLNPAAPDIDHPLVDLYKALHLSVRLNEMVYLSAENKRFLTLGLNMMTEP